MKKYDYNPTDIGSRIKRARNIKNLTQEYISNEVGISPQHVSEIERGETGISLGTLIKICKILDISSDYILFGDELSRSGNPLHELFESMNEADKLFIEDFIKFYNSRAK